MKYFLNPVSMSKEGRGFVNALCATILFVVFVILLCITVHTVKRYRNDEDEKLKRKKIISLIIADCLVLLFVIVVLILLYNGSVH